MALWYGTTWRVFLACASVWFHVSVVLDLCWKSGNFAIYVDIWSVFGSRMCPFRESRQA